VVLEVLVLRAKALVPNWVRGRAGSEVKPGNQTVLIVDDEAEDRQSIRTTLEACGDTVLEAGNYCSAVKTFEENRDAIDLLITDLALPDRNGCELAKSILVSRPDMKVLFISGHVGAELCRYYGLGSPGRHFLEKPFKPIELLVRVWRVLFSKGHFRFNLNRAA
jgi:two-component system cell cycle sensor histidine kinase/response regulator CckA